MLDLNSFHNGRSITPKYLERCQKNIFSDTESSESDDDNQQYKETTKRKRTDPFYGVYTRKTVDLEKMVKDEFNQFIPVKFENEKEEISKSTQDPEEEVETNK